MERRRDFGEEVVPQVAVVRFVEEIGERLGDGGADAISANFEDRFERLDLARGIFAVRFAFALRIFFQPGVNLGGLCGKPRDIAQPLEQIACGHRADVRSEEHTSELQSLMRISYAVFCLTKKNNKYAIHNQ